MGLRYYMLYITPSLCPHFPRPQSVLSASLLCLPDKFYFMSEQTMFFLQMANNKRGKRCLVCECVFLWLCECVNEIDWRGKCRWKAVCSEKCAHCFSSVSPETNPAWCSCCSRGCILLQKYSKICNLILVYSLNDAHTASVCSMFCYSFKLYS